MHARVFDHAGSAGARADVPARMAFRYSNNVGTRNYRPFAARWLAYRFPYRRFARALAGTSARLGADVDRYSFIVMDLHHLLLAGLPAHYQILHDREEQQRRRWFTFRKRSALGDLFLGPCG